MSSDAAHVLICPDSALLLEQVARLQDAAGPGCERKVYYGDEPELPAGLWRDLGSISLLGGTRLVVLRRAEKLKAETLRELDRALAGTTTGCVAVVCLECAWDRGRPKLGQVLPKLGLLDRARTAGTLWQQPALDAKSLPGYVAAWARREGFELKPAAARGLCERLPADAAAVRNELAKLALILGERREILPTDAEHVGAEGELAFFPLMDALTSGNLRPEVWREVLRQGESLTFQILGYLQGEARNAWMMTHGEDAAVRLPPFVKDKKARLGQVLGEDGLADLVDLCLEAELAIKSGRLAESEALERLVVGLQELASRSRTRGSRR